MAMMVEMVSDLVCPWCWVGLRRINAAIARLDSPDAVELKFRPFQLAPEHPPEGADYASFMRNKFGASDDPAQSRWAAMREMLENYGREEDIPFRFDGLKRRPNTVNAHRLVRWAQGQGLGIAAKETLFDAYFHRNLDIGNTDVLASLSDEIGLVKDVVIKLLAEDSDKNAVLEEEDAFRQLGIGGVPTYIIDHRYAVQGAQDTDQLVSILEKALSAPQES